jgi:hypothetical protein
MATNNEKVALSLIPEKDIDGDTKDNTKYASFKLKASPGKANATPKYCFTMLKVDGTQSIRQHIKWMLDLKKVYHGLEITTPADQQRLAEQMCSGAFKTAYTNGVESSISTRWESNKATAVSSLTQDVSKKETDEQFAARKLAKVNAVLKPKVEQTDLTEGVQAAITSICPYKVLEKQRAFMRRNMRKPQGMKTRAYVNHLLRINEQEIVHLPPFGPNQAFSTDELKEIIVWGLPNTWKTEMDKFDFNVYTSSVAQLVDFCERLESTEERIDGSKPKHNKGTSPPWKKSNKQDDKSSTKQQKGGRKWCVFHETDTHNTTDCHVIKKMKASRKPDGSKNWKNKAEQAKDKAKKELNALKKKVAKLQKNLEENHNVETKPKRKADDSDDEVNALEREMKDVDMQLAMFDEA